MCSNNIPLLSRRDILQAIRKGIDNDIWNKIPIHLKRDKEIIAEIRKSIPLTIRAIGCERNPMSPLRILDYDEHHNVISDLHVRLVVSYIEKQLHKYRYTWQQLHMYASVVQLLGEILPPVDDDDDVQSSNRYHAARPRKRCRFLVHRMLDQGRATNQSLRKLIGEFLGIPIGDELKCLHNARQNLMIYDLMG